MASREHGLDKDCSFLGLGGLVASGSHRDDVALMHFEDIGYDTAGFCDMYIWHIFSWSIGNKNHGNCVHDDTGTVSSRRPGAAWDI